MPKIKIAYPTGLGPDTEVEIEVERLEPPARDRLVVDRAAGQKLIEP